ncbi:MAG TPA: hypothetical protein VM939_13570 [Gemmatimonadaceae bacterium]|nr:hypothetical protein [Gemmatimonadaceae bacterium]
MTEARERSSPAIRRILRHLRLAAVAAVVAAIIWVARDSESTVENASTATAYVALIFLAASLAIGPLNVIRRKSNPVSTHLRRDIGIWAGIMGIVHTFLGLEVHMGGRLRRYFLPSTELGSGASAAGFISANYAGLIAAIGLLVLLLISNDIALRKLGTSRWKSIQRYNYLIVALVVAHGALYQLLERRAFALVIAFAGVILATALLQLRGRSTVKDDPRRPKHPGVQ